MIEHVKHLKTCIFVVFFDVWQFFVLFDDGLGFSDKNPPHLQQSQKIQIFLMGVLFFCVALSVLPIKLSSLRRWGLASPVAGLPAGRLRLTAVLTKGARGLGCSAQGCNSATTHHTNFSSSDASEHIIETKFVSGTTIPPPPPDACSRDMTSGGGDMFLLDGIHRNSHVPWSKPNSYPPPCLHAIHKRRG